MKHVIALLILLTSTTVFAGDTRCDRLSRDIASLERQIALLKASMNHSCRVTDDHEWQWGGKPYWNDPGRPTPVFPSPWARPVPVPVYSYHFIGFTVYGQAVYEIRRGW